MSEESQTKSGGSKTAIIAAVAAVAAAFIGYNLGFNSGEKGLNTAQGLMKEAQGQAKAALDQLTALQVTSTEQAKQVESQTAKLGEQTASVAALTAKVDEQTKQLESTKAELGAKDAQIKQQTQRIEAMDAQAKQLTRDANANNTEVTRLRDEVTKLTAQSDDYLATIMGAIDKKSFNLVVGGVQEWLVRNRVGVGLSYVSLADRSARITLAGESMNVVLQESQKIKLSDKSCKLTMTNIVSDSEAAFQVDCGGA